MKNKEKYERRAELEKERGIPHMFHGLFYDNIYKNPLLH